MSLENIQLLLPYMAPILGMLGAIILFIKKSVKNKKLTNVLEMAEEFTERIIPYIKEAEKLIHYTGEEKKNYVMTKLNQYAIENKIKFNQEEASKRIEELVGLTKEVNINSCEINNDKDVIKKSTMNETIEKQIKNILDGLAR